MVQMKRIPKIYFGVLAVCMALFFGSCSFLSIGDNDSDGSPSGVSQSQYGSLSVRVGAQSAARSVDVSSIVAADVSVSYSGITPAIASALTTEVKVSEGLASGVTIKNIPVGKNRVVTAQAKSSIDNVLSKIAGVTMTAVVDINAGENKSAAVNWESSRVGNVYKALLELNYDVSNLSPDTVKTYLPTDTHASLIDSAAIASAIKTNGGAASSANPSSYTVESGSLTFTSDVALSSLSFQICDPISKALTSLESGTNTIPNVAPGTWKVFGIVGGTVVYETECVIETGKTTNLGEISFKTPAPRLENADGVGISEFINGETTVYLKARTYDGEKELDGVKIYYTTDGSAPTTKSTLYTSSGISVSVGTTLKAIAVSVLANSDVSSWEFAEPTLGYTHPSSGEYSTVSEGEWASASYSLGATVSGGNTTFALYSANATKVLLEIYDAPYGEDAKYDYWLTKNTDTNVWNAKLSGDLTGAIYAYRVWGPNWTFSDLWTRGGSSAGFVSDCDSSGNRFNPNKVVFDPYAREMTHDPSNAAALEYSPSKATSAYGALSTGETYRDYDSGKIAPKGYVITDSTSYGTKPGIAQKDAIIYEAHVRGITKHSSASNLESILNGIEGFDSVQNVPEDCRGTYKGATYLIPYLKALGINTIELLPVHETDNDANPDDGPGGNFWGYMTFDYFAPDRRYSSDKTAGGPTREFKEMVKAFHEAGMEVYLDVVYNHSGEGGPWNGDKDSNAQTTVVSMRGIDNQTYYSLVAKNKSSYWQTTGCGNNLQCDNSTVRQFIIDSLTYWIGEMGVDGFRFDLATTLGREYDSSSGNWNYSNSAKTLVDIAALGKSRNVEMIAESWDCGDDSYQVGDFPAGWGGWNGRYRDTLRTYIGKSSRSHSSYGEINQYINGDYGNFNKEGGPHKSVNFVVAHDGFTLADLCSGYGSAGADYNKTLDWPFGPSDGGDGDAALSGFGTDSADKRQAVRNFFAIQMISRGVPMIVWGDELSRTQNGNNNPYNVDSVCTWNNYNMINTASPHTVSTGYTQSYHNNFDTFGNDSNINGNFKFAKYMMNLRANEPALRQDNYNISYDFKKEDGSSTLSDSDRCVWIRIDGDSVTGGSDYLVFMNMYTEKVDYTIPAADSGYHWLLLVDTANWAEKDFNCWSEDVATTQTSSYGVNAWSVVILKQESDAPTCETPVISGTETFADSTSVTITCTTSGATIYYTTDGSEPTSSSEKYTEPFSLNSTSTVKAIAVASGYNDSEVASKEFTCTKQCATPVITITSEGKVIITCETTGAEICYTTDGSEPTKESTKYSAAFSLNSTSTVKAIAVASDYSNSAVASESYTTVTFYFKVPNWDSSTEGGISGTQIWLNGNGNDNVVADMKACTTNQWSKYSANVTSLNTLTTYQLRIIQNNETKYMKYNGGNPTITPTTGFVVVDISGDNVLTWNNSDFTPNESCITTPSSDPNY